MNRIEDQNLETKPQWFVVRSNNRQERLAVASLRAEQIEAYLPLVVREIRGGPRKGEATGAPLFPGYLFVRLSLTSEAWRLVFTARGVNSVITWGGRVRPIAERVIAEIKAEERGGFVRLALDAPPVCRFKAGEIVTFQKGPFAALPAVFRARIGEHRCWVLISLLGETARLAQAQLDHIRA